eukprot:XP_008187088.2 PREDICTED: uncharacterized protein LOC103310469 [Acyrthosiphon pisum]
MSKRKNNPILDMYRKKQDNVNDPLVIPSPASPTEIIEDQEDQSIRKVLKNYSYQKNWEKSFNRLYYNIKKGGDFCKVCEKCHSSNHSALQKSKGIFICTPFINYRKATGKTCKLLKHANSENHAKALALNELFLHGKNEPIHTQMIQQSNSEKIQNRIHFFTFVHNVYFLAKQEIPHTTKYEPLLNKVVLKQNQSLLEWVEKQSDRSNYMSKNTSIEILNCIGTVLETRDSNELKNKYFSLMADESTNIKNVCEMTIIIRFVTDCGKIRELFVCIVELSGTNAETITETIDRELKKRELDYSKLIRLGFDGASNFSDSITGVRKRLSEIAHREIGTIHSL